MFKHYYDNLLSREAKSDDGFMGRTHALSALAVVLSVFAFVPGLFYKFSNNHITALVMLTLVALVTSGGALLPDLDNTNSSAKSQLGLIGDILSVFMRATAPVIKTAIHSKYDNNLENPHRSFYHTTVSALLFGGLFSFLCSPLVNINVFGKFTLTGRIMAIILAFIAIDLCLSTVIGSIWSSKNIIQIIASLGCSLGISFALLHFMPKTVPYTIVGVALGAGWFIHCLGDCFTTAGTPLLWPLKIKGKMWYDIRFLKIKAGGMIENFVFTPLFITISIIAFIVINYFHN